MNRKYRELEAEERFSRKTVGVGRALLEGAAFALLMAAWVLSLSLM
jgi:hypothetical protein